MHQCIALARSVLCTWSRPALLGLMSYVYVLFVASCTEKATSHRRCRTHETTNRMLLIAVVVIAQIQPGSPCLHASVPAWNLACSNLGAYRLLGTQATLQKAAAPVTALA
jgi:heme A synthase